MAYDPAVVSAIREIGQQRYANNPKKLRRYLEGQYSTGIVESGLRDLPGGDADSYGYRQQRLSGYGKQDLKTQINNLYDEFEQYDKGQPLGELVADVQRPAEQYRGRYGEASVMDQARKLAMGQGNDGAGAVSLGAQTAPVAASGGTMPGAAPSAPPTSNVFDYLANANPPSNDPLQAQLQNGWKLLSQLQNQQQGGTSAASGPTNAGGNANLQSILDSANAIDKKNNAGDLPYLWGGGHQAQATAPDSPITPLDCSGAVSRALGVDPRVSGDFAKWGQNGEGKNVTIYANNEHVLMKINGHFWGTSKQNPGGGAGWIPSDAISPDYLKRFTARHPPGM